MKNGFHVLRAFEEAVAEYTGAKYAVAVDSCSSALFLALKSRHRFVGEQEICIPSNTYISVPMAIVNAGFKPVLDKSMNDWEGSYYLEETNIVDSAITFNRNMYQEGTITCVSFHSKKPLKLGKGGAILTDNQKTYDWLKKAAYSGRSGCSIHEDDITEVGYNLYMPHQLAALGLTLLQDFPDHTPSPKPNYRDLTTFEVFKNLKVID